MWARQQSALWLLALLCACATACDSPAQRHRHKRSARKRAQERAGEAGLVRKITSSSSRSEGFSARQHNLIKLVFCSHPIMVHFIRSPSSITSAQSPRALSLSVCLHPTKCRATGAGGPAAVPPRRSASLRVLAAAVPRLHSSGATGAMEAAVALATTLAPCIIVDSLRQASSGSASRAHL